MSSASEVKVSPTYSLPLSINERIRIVPLILSSRVFNTPMLNELSTTFLITSLLRITPFGKTFSKLITFLVVSSVKVCCGFSTSSAVKVKFGSAIASSSFNKTSKFLTALFTLSTS